MYKIFTKSVFLTIGFLWLMVCAASAQTVVIGTIDPGPYGQGSTIAVPFKLNTAAGCASSTNVFNLYLSDAAGNFSASSKLIGSYTGFYGTFVNGVIPAGTAPGANYKLKIDCTDPAIAQAITGPIVITAATGVTAAASSSVINISYPEIYGACIGKDNASYTFLNNSTAGAVATATFFNEQTQAFEGAPLPLNGSFSAKLANYTVLVRAISAGVVGTKAYTLINNPVNNTFGASGSTQVCLNGKNKLSYSIDVTSPNGIQKNYPGLIYNVTWGDGQSSNFTLCDIIASGGIIDHLYTKSSCGNIANGQANVFQINLLPTSPICGTPVTAVTGYATVVSPPSNKIAGPKNVCTNAVVTFGNASIPGQDPNAKTFDCTNQNALYTWSVDGVVVAQNYPLTQSLDYKFTTHGQHTITLSLQNGAAFCDVKDTTITVCVQNPAIPKFVLQDNGTICTSGPLKVTNISETDEICNPSVTYKWIVTPVTGGKPVSYGSGTNANSYEPVFVFSGNGAYTVQLSITTPSCGEVLSGIQNVAVNLSPTATLSADAKICGTNKTLTFGPTGTVTKTTITGTEVEQPDTYRWTVTGGPYTFVNGTDASDRYPQIRFTAYATYVVAVTHKNNCGQVSKQQKLVFQEAPIINSGGDQTICEGNSVTLQGSIPPSGVTSYQWTGGAGTFTPSRNVQQPTYTPTPDEVAAGTVTLYLEATTTLPAPCNTLISPAVITITRKDNVTSVKTAEVCTGQNFNYTITAGDPATTFSWTAALQSGNATGFGASGSGNTINDIITDTGAGDAVVVYTITPITNGCPGNKFTLTLTVNRVPNISAGNPTICTGSPAGIVLTSSTANTVYTWVSTVVSGLVTGNTNNASASAVTGINDVLINNGTTSATVKYTITPYHGACQGAPIDVLVTVYPPAVIANAGPNEELCATPTYQLKGNNPAPGIGMWSLASGQGGITFSNNTDPNAVASGLQGGQVYKFVWSVSASASCPANTDTVTVITDVPTIAGTATGAVPVCADANAGTVTLTGHTGRVLGWEFSTDKVTWAATPQADTTVTYQYAGLTQTTYFRAIVQNGNCTIERSAAVTITVNQPVIAADAGANQRLCNETTATLNGNAPGTFTGVWSQVAGPAATITQPNNPGTTVSDLQGNNTYVFVWTIKGLPPCGDSRDTVEIVNQPDVIAGFTPSKTSDCGAYSVKFTNTSTPSIATTVYRWDFGDGSPISNEISPSHTFQPKTDGRDTIYHVSLSILNNCTQRDPIIRDIIVHPATPVARMFPGETNGCGNLIISADNTAPGNNLYYDWYLYNKATGALIDRKHLVDKSSVQFPRQTPSVPTKYELLLTVTDSCFHTANTSVTYTISPATFVARAVPKDNLRKGCAPLNVTLTNVSTSGDNFRYLIFDAATKTKVDSIPGLPGETDYTFARAGTYYVKIVAINDCAAITSKDSIAYEAYGKPVPNFDADVKSGCKNVIVQFSNLTPPNGASPANTLAYDWDFGDGTHSTAYTPQPHTYSSKLLNYTVKLTVTNLVTGCSDVITKANFIKVSPAPNVDFSASPGFVTTIPNYHFAFDDQTTGNPVSWAWDFGDGSTSTGQNPGHTYADTGTYKVTLKVISRDGCDSTVTHNVQITGIPGQLYMPNAFMPNSATTELQTFTVKGSGLESWHMQIFNNWGQLVWETTKLSARGEPVESWDGTFKGAPAPQGVYVWQASAHFINGTEWKGMSYNNSLPKRTGVVHLIR